jgi:hypothetical protein
MSEAPFTIAVPEADVVLLRDKLALTRLPDELEGAEWDYGTPLADVRRLVERWRGGYDWRAAAAALNAELPMFTRDVDIDGHGALNVHYVHKKSAAPDAVPLLFVHGCTCHIPASVLACNKADGCEQGLVASSRSARFSRCSSRRPRASRHSTSSRSACPATAFQKRHASQVLGRPRWPRYVCV